MILTFIAMVIDTLSFLLLTGFYMIIVTAVFTTLFQDVNPKFYKDF